MAGALGLQVCLSQLCSGFERMPPDVRARWRVRQGVPFELDELAPSAVKSSREFAELAAKGSDVRVMLHYLAWG